MTDGEDESGEVRQIDVDRRGAYLTFDALERAACWAVAADEMEVAAEYVDTLMLHESQLDDWHEDYMEESVVLAEEDPEIGAQQYEVVEMIREVRRWALENDHDVARWFDG
jgi:hypothetical protein